MEDLKAILAENVKTYRECKHLTQAQLAEKLNYSRDYINKIENEKYTPSLAIYYIAKELGVKVEQLFAENRLPI